MCSTEFHQGDQGYSMGKRTDTSTNDVKKTGYPHAKINKVEPHKSHPI